MVRKLQADMKLKFLRTALRKAVGGAKVHNRGGEVATDNANYRVTS